MDLFDGNKSTVKNNGILLHYDAVKNNGNVNPGASRGNGIYGISANNE